MGQFRTRAPLLVIDVDHIVIDDLHSLLRVTDRLEGAVFNEINQDWTDPTTGVEWSAAARREQLRLMIAGITAIPTFAFSFKEGKKSK